MKTRREILQDLVNFTRPLEQLREELKAFPWDSDEALINLSPNQLCKVLNLYLKKSITLKDLNQWAETIECREDIEMEETTTSLIEDIITQLATPEIFYEVKSSTIQEWVSKLNCNKLS